MSRKLKSPDRYRNTTAFTDMLFNLLIGFVFLFMIAFILINPITKKNDAPRVADYLIVIEWDHDLNDDIDLWVEDPTGNIVSFTKKHSGFMNLEKDDLGWSNDTVVLADGKVERIDLNREVVTLRGTTPGWYKVMAHVYNRKPGKAYRDIATITVKIIKLNMYKEEYTGKVQYTDKGQQLTLVNFKLDGDKKFLGYNLERFQFITRGAAITSEGANPRL